MDFVLGGGGGATSGGNAGPTSTSATSLGHENGPILFTETNRTSAIDDLRSVVIYVFIVTIFVGFFLILPGIRSEKFPTFLCITTSLVVTSIILIALFGTTWHVGQASIAAPYKAHSMDRIQGLLRIKVGLSSVNITLQAHKYYQLQQMQPSSTISPEITSKNQTKFHNSSSSSTSSLDSEESTGVNNLADELLEERTADGTSVDTELEVEEEAFPSSLSSDSSNSPETSSSNTPRRTQRQVSGRLQRSVAAETSAAAEAEVEAEDSILRYTVDERSDLDINYNERFYWIEPQQMRQEHHQALERGLPYPILTVVEYLSQDEAGFSWSRQYRSAGYYSHILLWLGLCLCALMFFLHCATPKYGIYAMQFLGALLLFTNFTYSILVPRGDQKLVIPFEGQSLELQFGWNYWLVFIGGCLSLSVGTLIVLIDSLFPNYIFTTILDVDFDSHNKYYKNKQRQLVSRNQPLERPTRPPFIEKKDQSNTSSSKEEKSNKGYGDDEEYSDQSHMSDSSSQTGALTSTATTTTNSLSTTSSRRNSATGFSTNSTSEMQLQQRHHRKQQPTKRDSVVEMEANRLEHIQVGNRHHYSQQANNYKQTKSSNLKSMDQRRYEYGEELGANKRRGTNDVRL